MSDADRQDTPTPTEQAYLRRSLRRIVIGQELGPRSPRWRAAWKRTLFSYANRLSQLRAQRPGDEQS